MDFDLELDLDVALDLEEGYSGPTYHLISLPPRGRAVS